MFLKYSGGIENFRKCVCDKNPVKFNRKSTQTSLWTPNTTLIKSTCYIFYFEHLKMTSILFRGKQSRPYSGQMWNHMGRHCSSWILSYNCHCDIIPLWGNERSLSARGPFDFLFFYLDVTFNTGDVFFYSVWGGCRCSWRTYFYFKLFYTKMVYSSYISLYILYIQMESVQN